MTIRGRFVLAAAAAVAVDVAALAALGDNTVDFGIIDLRIVRNDGVAFGIGSFIPPVLLVLLTLSVTVVLAVTVWKGLLSAGLSSGLVLGGAVANVMDRVLDGTVVDMLDLGWWPAFNVADVCIVVGVAGLLLQSRAPASSVVQESM